MKAVFIQAFLATYRWSQAYSDWTDEEICKRLDEEDFEKVIRPGLRCGTPQTYLSVKEGENLIAYALFEFLEKGEVYLVEMAVLPKYWRQGLGRQMIGMFLERNPDTEKVLLVTEHINKLAQKFYESFGFSRSGYQREDFPEERFVSYELKVITSGS